MKITKDLDKLRILVFWEILKSGDFTLLDVDWKEGNKYTKAQTEELQNAWMDVYDSYFLLEGDSKTKLTLSKSNEEMLLISKINLLIETLSFLEWTDRHKDFIVEKDFLEFEHRTYKLFEQVHPGIKLRYFEGVEVNAKLVNRLISSLTNTYNIKKKNTDRKIDNEIKNIYTLVARVSEIIGFRLDVEKMSVSEWLAWQQRAKEKSVPSPKKVGNGKK